MAPPIGRSRTPGGPGAWARPLDGAPCSEIPWIGDKTYWDKAHGVVRRVERLRRITVPGAYRICAQVANWAFRPDPWTVVETSVVVSQACTDARRTLSYELLVGVERASARAAGRRTAVLEAVLEVVSVVAFDLRVARHHAVLAAHTARQGRPRGAHDLQIAATARATGRTLITTDARAFAELPGVVWRQIGAQPA